MKKISRILDLIRSVCTEISSWIVLFLTLFITLDVVLRYFLGASIPAGIEITQVLLVGMVFFAFGSAQKSKVHIRVDVAVEKFPPKTRYYWELVVTVFALTFFLFIFVEAWVIFQDSYAIKEYYGGAVPVPIYPARGAIVIGCGLMIVELLRDISFILSEKGKAAFAPSLEQREIEETLAKVEEEKKMGG